jgi:octaprenyl-diphosphate synthase
MDSLGAGYDAIKNELEDVRSVIERELQSDVPGLQRFSEVLNASSGKMLRPALVLLSGQATGEIGDMHKQAAAVTEMIHLATLLHDDVLDDANVRRGVRSMNQLAGNTAAVLLGDYIFIRAYRLCQSEIPPDVLRILIKASNFTCEGELMQTALAGNFSLDEAEYMEIIGRKTARLMSACCTAGGKLAGASDAEIDALRNYGLNLGIAFQIVDDVLDLLGREENTGKTLGRDLAKGKLTLPVIYWLRTDPDARQILESALKEKPAEAVKAVKDKLASSGAFDYAAEKTRSYVEEAESSLGRLPETEASRTLRRISESILSSPGF